MRPRILVVDDALAVSQGIRNRFHDKYDIVLAQNGSDALAHLKLGVETAEYPWQ